MEVVILIGLQGAGKTTFYRRHFADSHVHVSRDNFPNNGNPSRRQRQLIEAALSEGRPVIVDNTNVTCAERLRIIEIALELGARVRGYYFDSDVRDCIARNNERQGKAKIPVVGILATKKKLEVPQLSEGFHELYGVTLDEESGVTVVVPIAATSASPRPGPGTPPGAEPRPQAIPRRVH